MCNWILFLFGWKFVCLFIWDIDVYFSVIAASLSGFGIKVVRALWISENSPPFNILKSTLRTGVTLEVLLNSAVKPFDTGLFVKG